MRRWQQSRTAVVALSAVLALGMAACGGDDDDDDSSSATTTPATVAPVQGQPLVTIDMVDHAFQVSGPLTAGGTVRISNKGAEFHMVGIGRFKAGKTLFDLQQALAQAGGPGAGATSTTVAGATTSSTRGSTTSTTRGSTTTTVRGTTTTTAATQDNPIADIVEDFVLPSSFMGPNETAEVTVPSLQQGTYALLCFIPTEGEGTPHFAKGMVGQLEVVAGTPPAPPVADATYRLTPGRAIEGPATLTAGKHTIKFEAAIGSEQLEPVIVRLNQGSTFARVETAVNNIFESDTPPAKGAASRVPGQIVYSAFDLLSVTEFYVTVELRAGNYVIVAEDTDVNSPGNPREIINIRVA